MKRDATAADAARKKRAQQSVKRQSDGVVARADRALDWSTVQRLDWRKVTLTGTALALKAMVAYIIMIIVWFKLYHRSFGASVTVFMLLLLAAALANAYARRAAVGRSR